MRTSPRGFPLALAFAVSGCASTPAYSPPPTAAAEEQVGLSPGDAVKVDVWRGAELSGEFAVTPEGRVVFPLLGERDVRGIPAAELEAKIGSEYREYLENPSVTITTLRRIAILGAVRQPGLYTIDRTITLTDALALAGGLGPTGDRNSVRLIRDGSVLVRSLDLGRSMTTTAMRSGDQIEVGERSWISRNTAVMTTSIVATASIIAAIIVSR